MHIKSIPPKKINTKALIFALGYYRLRNYTKKYKWQDDYFTYNHNLKKVGYWRKPNDNLLPTLTSRWTDQFVERWVKYKYKITGKKSSQNPLEICWDVKAPVATVGKVIHSQFRIVQVWTYYTAKRYLSRPINTNLILELKSKHIGGSRNIYVPVIRVFKNILNSNIIYVVVPLVGSYLRKRKVRTPRNTCWTEYYEEPVIIDLDNIGSAFLFNKK